MKKKEIKNVEEIYLDESRNVIKLLNQDCLIGLDSLKDNSIDLIIADPPYVISVESQFHTMKDRKNKRTGTNFGAWDYEFDNQLWIDLAFRKLKKGGSLVCFNDLKKATTIIDIATNTGLIYKDTMIWNKNNPMPRNRDRRYVQDIELIQWFVKKGDKWTFNRQKENYESCIKRYPVESGGAYKRIHPTQKPLKLIEDLIHIHSNVGDIVCDPFSGSGSTMITCKKNNRNFVGFEIEKSYYEKSIERYNELFKKST